MQIPVTGPRVVGLYDFSAERDIELSFDAGDVMTLLGHVDNEWIRVCTCIYRTKHLNSAVFVAWRNGRGAAPVC